MSATEPSTRPWGRPDPAVAETRLAVRRVLAAISPAGTASTGPLALVALSGGADSLALAAAAAYEAARSGLRIGAVVVDHGLQAGSDAVADRAAATARRLGLDPVVVHRVDIPAGSGEGPEAAARDARYTTLEGARVEHDAVAVMTAHTRDDQAEQVLLALARGSGTRAIAGIPPARGAILRPFLDVSRETTVRACAAQGLEPWHDPHNLDPAFTRVRVRDRVLPTLERELGPGVAASLARSAALAREDADALDGLAAAAMPAVVTSEAGGVAISVAGIRSHPVAIQHRIIRAVARDAFAAHLGREHTVAIASLIGDWRGQGPIHAPGITVAREDGRLIVRGDRGEAPGGDALQ